MTAMSIPASIPALSCRGLQARRASGFVLDIPEMELEPGTVAAVGGPNGSGKSTLLLACAGLLDLAGGRIDLADDPYHQGRAPAPARLRQRVVLVPQDPYLLRGNVQRNLSWGLRLRRVQKKERQIRSAQILEALGIEPLALRDVGRLSGGQRTLVAVARALVLRPAVLLLDEVTRDLDTHHRLAVIKAVQELSSRGTAVLLATHDHEMADQLADRHVSLRDGRIAEPRS